MKIGRHAIKDISTSFTWMKFNVINYHCSILHKIMDLTSISYYKVENNLNFTKLYYNGVVRLRINYS